MADISGFGTIVALVASVTFPAVLPITQFADDVDPLDSSAIDIADKAMSLNGDPLFWAKAILIPMALGVVPASADDINLQILLNANRVAANKTSAGDVITATVTYPNGLVTTLARGRIISGPPVLSVASAARFKSRVYGFVIADKSGA
jgi:hypothetical protein